jgi:16S rRNA (uracil1498-N3)-methyltransferase
MTRRRFLADEIAGDRAAVLGKHAQHLARVLRARIGQEFEIAAGSSVRHGRVTRVSEDRVEFALGEPVASSLVAPVRLVLAIFKFDRMEWAIEKCTELGVASILPVSTQRTDAHLAGAAGKRVARWQRIALQASEQSRRSEPPVIEDPQPLRDVVRQPGGARIVMAESGADLSLKEAIRAGQPPLFLAVGPEGGWTEVEMNLFSASGWTAASLGPTILRAETAAIVATALALSELRGPA